MVPTVLFVIQWYSVCKHTTPMFVFSLYTFQLGFWEWCSAHAMHPPASLHFVWRNKFVNMPRYANCFCFSRPSRFAHGLWSTVCISMRVSIGLHTIWIAAFEHLCYIIPKSCVCFGIEPLTNHLPDLCILTPSITLIGWLLCVPRVVLCTTPQKPEVKYWIKGPKFEIWNDL